MPGDLWDSWQDWLHSHDIQWAAIFGVAFGFFATIGVLVAAFSLLETKRARVGEACSTIWTGWENTWNIRQMVSGYRTADDLIAAMEEWRVNRADEYYALLRLPNYFEQLSVLVRRKAVNFGFFKECLGAITVGTWNDWMPVVQRIRELDGGGKPFPKGQAPYSAWESVAKKMARKLKMPFYAIS